MCDEDDDAPIIVFLIGGPGSGKTTQAEALAGDDDSKSVRVYVKLVFSFFFHTFSSIHTVSSTSLMNSHTAVTHLRSNHVLKRSHVSHISRNVPLSLVPP